MPGNPYAGLEFTEVTKLCEWADAKHIAFILDACFSGKALGLTRGVPSTAADKYLTRRAWQVLTAGGDEVVADARSMTDILIRTLREGIPDESGPLTFSQVGSFVKSEMAARTRGIQIPVCQYLTGSSNGEMILLAASPLDALPERLRADLDDTNRRIRYFAIGEVANWLDDPLVGLAVREVLEKIVIEDPDSDVRRRAYDVLGRPPTLTSSPDVAVVKPEPELAEEVKPKWGPGSVISRRTLAGHSSAVNSVAFSPDGTILASGSSDHSIMLWPLGGEKRSRIVEDYLEQHTDSVLSVAFSPDGALLASGSSDHTIILWELAIGKWWRILEGHTDWIRSVAFSPDGTMLASGSNDGTVILWDVVSGKQLHILRGQTSWTGQVLSVAFSSDWVTLASSFDDTIILWDTANGELIRTLVGHTDSVNSVAFSRDGVTLASGSKDNHIILWDTATGARRQSLNSGGVQDVAFSPDGSTLASASGYHTVALWNVVTGARLNTLHRHVGWVQSVAFSSDGRLLASGSKYGSITLWDVKS